MGYRSEVAFTITFNTKEEVDNYITPHLLDESLSDFRECFTRVSDDPASILFYHAELKWYDSYSFVQTLTSIYKGAVQAGGSYNFIRIGEDDSDIETDCSGWYEDVDSYSEDFYIIRSIQTPLTEPL